MSVAHTNPQPVNIHDWLDQLYGTTETGWLTLFAIDRANGERHVKWQPVNNLHALTADAEQLAPTSCVWFGVATRRQPLGGRRGGASECSQLPGLWIDIDVEGPNHKGGHRLPATLDQAHQLVDTFPLPPTAIIATGGGLQAWWLFAEPYDTDQADQLLARWGHTWTAKAAEHGWHLDNVFDIARVMRLPGTQNRKTTPTPVTIVAADYQRRYGPDDLDQYLQDVPDLQADTTGRSQPYIGPERPGDAFNATRTGSDLLTRAGFELARRDRNGDEHWVRPGKERRQGTSATVYRDDGHTTIWSDTVTHTYPAIRTQRPYDPFGLYTALWHNGDFTASSDALAAQGYGQKHKADDDMGWLIDAHTERDWQPGTPFTQRQRPVFPIDALPAWAGRYCQELARQRNAPVDLAAQTVLAVLAALSAGHARIQVAENWTADTNLYLLCAYRSGGGKSSVVTAISEPVNTVEQTLIDQTAKDRQQAEFEKRKADAQAKTAETSAKNSGSHEEWDEVQTLLAAAEAVEVPPEPRLLADDVTPEALNHLLATHGRIASISSEGGIIDSLGGRYNDTKDLDPFLKAWDGVAIRVDRKGSARIIATHPLLTYGVAVQPAVLEQLGQNRQFKGRGLVARFMPSLPHHELGYADHDQTDIPIPQAVIDTYNQTAVAFGLTLNAWQEPHTVVYTDEARQARKAWFKSHEHRMRVGDDLHDNAEYIPKIRSSVVRLAGILALADSPHTRTVDAATFARAVAVGEYWIGHSLIADDMLGADADTFLARKILAWVRKNGDEQVSRRDIFRAVKTVEFDRVEAIQPGVELLVDMGWLREIEGERRPGRPSVTYTVNPSLWCDKTDTTTESDEKVGSVGSVSGPLEVLISTSTSSSSVEIPENENPQKQLTELTKPHPPTDTPPSVTELTKPQPPPSPVDKSKLSYLLADPEETP